MKKMLSLILALMLCALPCLAVAEGDVIGGADDATGIVVTGEPLFILPDELEAVALEAGRKGTSTLAVTEVSGINTGSAEVDAALIDLIKALGIKSTVQGDETEFALSISGTDVLTFGLGLGGEDAYVKSNLLGGTIVIRGDEVEGLINRLLDMMVMMEAMTEEEVAELKGMVGTVVQAFSSIIDVSMDAELTEEDLLALDFSSLTEVLETVTAKAQMVENPVVPRNCDPAVAGVTLNATNEDMVQIVKALLQFVKDNPELMNFIGLQFGVMTEEQRESMWALNQLDGSYATKEEYLAENPTIEQVLNEVLAELEGKKLLDGDYVININLDEAGLPVYMTFTLPMYTEQEALYTDAEVVGETTVIEVVYSRMTVAHGVSHVINLTVDGETLTADTLISGNTAHIVLSVPEEEPVIIDATVEGNTLSTTMTIHPEDTTVVTCTFDGSYLYTDAEYVLTGKLTVENVFTPAETEAPTLNGMTLPGYEANKPKPRTDTLTIDCKVDYDLNGVDFTGVTNLAVSFNGFRIALQANSFTSDPADSIMAGEVVRPAELDDAAFANWFVGLVNNLESWTGNVIMALPESLLTLLMSSGM